MSNVNLIREHQAVRNGRFFERNDIMTAVLAEIRKVEEKMTHEVEPTASRLQQVDTLWWVVHLIMDRKQEQYKSKSAETQKT